MTECVTDSSQDTSISSQYHLLSQRYKQSVPAQYHSTQTLEKKVNIEYLYLQQTCWSTVEGHVLSSQKESLYLMIFANCFSFLSLSLFDIYVSVMLHNLTYIPPTPPVPVLKIFIQILLRLYNKHKPVSPPTLPVQ